MEKNEIKKGIYWVGAIDWDIRNFHGYLTQRGTTYNSYLIVDEKIVLVDTVKKTFFGEMLDNISKVLDPAKIDYILSNHVEMDHSGAIEDMLEIAPNAKIITSVQGKRGLKKHFRKDWHFMVVKSGDTLNIGSRELHFVHTPMVHWPDSMVTYIGEDKLLLPNDAFGQHIASPERFDDEMEWGILKEEAAKYYANIVMPYSKQVNRALDALSGLDIDMIAPSHGIIWRGSIPRILAQYSKWANNETEKKALVVYDSMWGSTKKIALALKEGMSAAGLKVTLRNLQTNHISDILKDILTSRFILLGSPTLNNGYMPSMGGLLTYLEGLAPKKRIGMAFGSYGWGGQAVGKLEKFMVNMEWDLPLEGLNINYVPTHDDLEEARNMGIELVARSSK